MEPESELVFGRPRPHRDPQNTLTRRATQLLPFTFASGGGCSVERNEEALKRVDSRDYNLLEGTARP